MCIIVSWGLTLYQGYIILTAWYLLQPCLLIIRTSKKCRFKNPPHHGDTQSGKEYDILLHFANPNYHIYLFFCYFFFPHYWIYVWKQAKYTCSETTNPIKDCAQIGTTPILRVWHIKQLRYRYHNFRSRCFSTGKKVLKSLSWLMLLCIVNF